jgi:hypothetical protein
MIEYDSPEWQDIRDAKLLHWVGDLNAIAYVGAVSDAAELFDDIVDRDTEIENSHVERVLFSLLTQLPLNPFFDAYKHQLCPIMFTGINAWLDATKMEKGSDHEKSHAYVLRDWYMELLMYTIYLTRGREYMRSVSVEVRAFFMAETLEEYKEKLK